MFFSWFTNMAMHVGMGDLSIFRYARKARYGLATATGMYLGHFLAWIAASMLYALQLHRDPSNTDVLPGPLAAGACGIVGLLCVIIAGWTTANPTIYRAGLAFQAIVPTASRFRVTFLTGLACAVAGMFPAIAMKLLGFVALYGLALMPMGAVVFCDYWLMQRMGMRPFYAEVSGRSVNWAPAIAWLVTLAICLTAVWQGYIEIYFAGLPGWFIAAVLYLAASRLLQRRTEPVRSVTT
jgi:purine-cytosine permease-like protein